MVPERQTKSSKDSNRRSELKSDEGEVKRKGSNGFDVEVLKDNFNLDDILRSFRVANAEKNFLTDPSNIKSRVLQTLQ